MYVVLCFSCDLGKWRRGLCWRCNAL